MSARLQLIASGIAAARAAPGLGNLKLVDAILAQTSANVAVLQAADDGGKVLPFPNSKRAG